MGSKNLLPRTKGFAELNEENRISSTVPEPNCSRVIPLLFVQKNKRFHVSQTNFEVTHKYDTILYDTIEEFNMDSKAEYTA